MDEKLFEELLKQIDLHDRFHRNQIEYLEKKIELLEKEIMMKIELLEKQIKERK